METTPLVSFPLLLCPYQEQIDFSRNTAKLALLRVLVTIPIVLGTVKEVCRSRIPLPQQKYIERSTCAAWFARHPPSLAGSALPLHALAGDCSVVVNSGMRWAVHPALEHVEVRPRKGTGTKW